MDISNLFDNTESRKNYQNQTKLNVLDLENLEVEPSKSSSNDNLTFLKILMMRKSESEQKYEACQKLYDKMGLTGIIDEGFISIEEITDFLGLIGKDARILMFEELQKVESFFDSKIRDMILLELFVPTAKRTLEERALEERKLK